MKKQFIVEKNFGDWYKHLDHTYSLMLSDDIDSWLTSKIIERDFGCKLDLFNSFSSLYFKEGVDIYNLKRGKIIAIDIDISKNRCFSNHVTYINNPECINLNKGISSYYDKFAGSTLLTVLSLYNYDLSDFTEQQLEILISIDTAFKQYFFDSSIFKYYYSDVLEYPIFLDVVKDKNKEYFYKIIRQYKLHEKIYVDDNGYLKTNIKLDELSEIFNIDLSLPQEKFEPFYHMQTVSMPLDEFKRVIDKGKIFSSALAKKNYIVASIKY